VSSAKACSCFSFLFHAKQRKANEANQAKLGMAHATGTEGLLSTQMWLAVNNGMVGCRRVWGWGVVEVSFNCH